MFFAKYRSSFFWKVLGIIFGFIMLVYQGKLLFLGGYGDEAETIVASLMMASGEKIYSDIFNHHGPLTFIFGYFISKFGIFNVWPYRIPIIFLQTASIAFCVLSPVISNTRERFYALAVVGGLTVLFLPEEYGSLYLYQSIATYFLMISLSQFVLPSFFGSVSGAQVYWGSFLIGCLPFLAITYLPPAIGLTVVVFKRSIGRRVVWGLVSAFVLNLTWLVYSGSISGYIAYHFYLNFWILPHYSKISLTSMLASFTHSGGSVLATTLLLICGFLLLSKYRVVWWRVCFLLGSLAFFFLRGSNFYGLPFYGAVLVLILVLIKAMLPKRIGVVGLWLTIAGIWLHLVMFKTLDKQGALRYSTDAQMNNSEITDFLKISNSLTNTGDKILAYPFQNEIYLASQRLPASGHFFYFPWQAEYNKRPILGIRTDVCMDIVKQDIKLIYLTDVPIWNRYEWRSFSGCISEIIDKNYIRLPGTNCYVIANLYEDANKVLRDLKNVVE